MKPRKRGEYVDGGGGQRVGEIDGFVLVDGLFVL
jgi:hypothetical protein